MTTHNTAKKLRGEWQAMIIFLAQNQGVLPSKHALKVLRRVIKKFESYSENERGYMNWMLQHEQAKTP